MLEKRFPLIAFSLIITCLLWLFVGTPFIATLSVGICIYAFFLFIDRLGTTIPFRELSFLVATIQLLLSSYLAFYIQPPNPIFAPKGNPDAYFNYAIPGILLFSVGLFTFKPKLAFPLNIKDYLKSLNIFKLGQLFIYAGYFAIFAAYIAPRSIQYFLVLVSFLTYIGGFIVLFSEVPRSSKIQWILIASLPVINGALYAGIFFMAMIWMVYFFLYYMLLVSPKWINRVIWVLVGLYLVLVVDSAKTDYRAWNESNYLSASYSPTVRLMIFSEILWDTMTLQTLFSEENMSGRVTRANQGALVTWVMAHTPSVEPYANGATIYESVIASIFPRFVMENKAQSGGKIYFEKYTGYTLHETSMNLGLLGEGWANFGYTGGLIFMYCVGAFYSLVYYYFSKIINNNPVYFFFIPFLFIYSIKAEDDLLTPLNHIVKASFVLWVLHYTLIRRILQRVSI